MIVQKIYTHENTITKDKRDRKDKKKNLLLFFAGWGMDEQPFLEYAPGKRDFIICYDYRSLAFNEELLNDYTDIKVVAWSMGVWAASQVLDNLQLPVTESIAVNGTVYPVDDKKGISRNTFSRTLKGMNNTNLGKFRRRMCGKSLENFLNKAPIRPVEELKKELAAIGELCSVLPPKTFQWSLAYIGTNDKIFTLENQVNAWQGNNIRITGCEHYPEGLWHELFDTKHPEADKQNE